MLSGVEWVEGLAAVRLRGLDPVAHATGPIIYEQLKGFFTEAVSGRQPWYNTVQTWPQWVQELDSEGVRFICFAVGVAWSPTRSCSFTCNIRSLQLHMICLTRRY